MKLEFTRDQLILIKHLASQSGKTTSEWAKQALLAQIPRGMEQKLLREGQARAAMGAVFNTLEMQDNEHPAEAALPVQEPESPPVPQKQGNTHSCFYLDPEQPPQWMGQCSGTCKSPKQLGRVCFWMSAKAKECPVFRPRTVAR